MVILVMYDAPPAIYAPAIQEIQKDNSRDYGRDNKSNRSAVVDVNSQIRDKKLPIKFYETSSQRALTNLVNSRKPSRKYDRDRSSLEESVSKNQGDSYSPKIRIAKKRPKTNFNLNKRHSRSFVNSELKKVTQLGAHNLISLYQEIEISTKDLGSGHKKYQKEKDNVEYRLEKRRTYKKNHPRNSGIIVLDNFEKDNFIREAYEQRALEKEVQVDSLRTESFKKKEESDFAWKEFRKENQDLIDAEVDISYGMRDRQFKIHLPKTVWYAEVEDLKKICDDIYDKEQQELSDMRFEELKMEFEDNQAYVTNKLADIIQRDFLKNPTAIEVLISQVSEDIEFDPEVSIEVLHKYEENINY